MTISSFPCSPFFYHVSFRSSVSFLPKIAGFRDNAPEEFHIQDVALNQPFERLFSILAYSKHARANSEWAHSFLLSIVDIHNDDTF